MLKFNFLSKTLGLIRKKRNVFKTKSYLNHYLYKIPSKKYCIFKIHYKIFCNLVNYLIIYTACA